VLACLENEAIWPSLNCQNSLEPVQIFIAVHQHALHPIIDLHNPTTYDLSLPACKLVMNLSSNLAKTIQMIFFILMNVGGRFAHCNAADPASAKQS
jgi:hypothetical protein